MSAEDRCDPTILSRCSSCWIRQFPSQILHCHWFNVDNLNRPTANARMTIWESDWPRHHKPRWCLKVLFFHRSFLYRSSNCILGKAARKVKAKSNYFHTFFHIISVNLAFLKDFSAVLSLTTRVKHFQTSVIDRSQHINIKHRQRGRKQQTIEVWVLLRKYLFVLMYTVQRHCSQSQFVQVSSSSSTLLHDFKNHMKQKKNIYNKYITFTRTVIFFNISFTKICKS